MNATAQMMQGIRDQYYWINEYQTLGRKDTVHMLILIIFIIIFVCIVIWYTKKEGDKQ